MDIPFHIHRSYFQHQGGDILDYEVNISSKCECCFPYIHPLKLFLPSVPNSLSNLLSFQIAVLILKPCFTANSISEIFLRDVALDKKVQLS